MVTDRVRALWNLNIPEIREFGGLHEYDGHVMDLSPAGIAASLRLIGQGEVERDRHDEAHLKAIEEGTRTAFEVAEAHRWNPMVHLYNLDISCYDREYAPPEVRREARANHLSQWPDAIEATLQSLDSVPSPVATALLGATTGLKAGVNDPKALAAHERFVERVQDAAEHGPPDFSLGGAVLTALLGDGEGISLDLDQMEARADRERIRLRERLKEDCERLRRGASDDVRGTVRELLSDYPEDEAVYRAARDQIDELRAFTLENDLLPPLGGECNVGPAPESRRYAMAMMSWTAPYEEEAPAWYYVNPPEPTWDEEAKNEWRSVFSATTLPAITAHEVIPGHFAHGRILRQAVEGDVRRSLCSSAFVEGWAHYAEELMVETGFRSSDPRFAIGVWVEALLRVTRLAVALGVHRGSMKVEEAIKRFEEDAYLKGPAARSEAMRSTFDPTYGRYTWGKLEIQALRDEAIAAWGSKFSLRRFHESLLALGAPPLGTIGDALGD